MNIYSDESWSVVLSAKGDSLIIGTTDYHAGPLTLSLAQLTEAIKSSGVPEASRESVAIDRTADQVEVGRKGRFVLAISKKDKSLLIQTKDGAEIPLKLSRKELYELGKMMNRRVKRTKRIKA